MFYFKKIYIINGETQNRTSFKVAQIVFFFQKSVASIKRLLDESNKEIYIHNKESLYYCKRKNRKSRQQMN